MTHRAVNRYLHNKSVKLNKKYRTLNDDATLKLNENKEENVKNGLISYSKQNVKEEVPLEQEEPDLKEDLLEEEVIVSEKLEVDVSKASEKETFIKKKRPRKISNKTK